MALAPSGCLRAPDANLETLESLGLSAHPTQHPTKIDHHILISKNESNFPLKKISMLFF
jgi:hypothetical protein